VLVACQTSAVAASSCKYPALSTTFSGRPMRPSYTTRGVARQLSAEILLRVRRDRIAPLLPVLPLRGDVPCETRPGSFTTFSLASLSTLRRLPGHPCIGTSACIHAKYPFRRPGVTDARIPGS
jgi:hypothetical protein